MDEEDAEQTRRELREAQSEIEHLRQQSHERKLALDQQLFMVDALTGECAALLTDNGELRRKQLLQEDLIRRLSDDIRDNSDEDQRLSERSNVGPDAAELQEDVSRLNVENNSLAEELAALKGQCSTWEADIKRAQSRNKNLEELVGESYLEVVTLKETLRCVKDECASWQDRTAATRADYCHNVEVLTETRDALAQALGELHVARAPDMPARGNSIFSELEDRRASLLKRYRDLKGRYGELIKRCSAQARDMSKLRSDKLSVLRLAEDARAEEDGERTELVAALEARVADLERANKQLAAELRAPVRVVTEVDAAALRYLETVAAEAREEVWTLRRELDDRSLVLLMNQRQLNARQAELRLYRAENLRLKGELGDVRLRQQHVLCADETAGKEKSQPLETQVGQGDVKPRVAVQFQISPPADIDVSTQDGGQDDVTSSVAVQFQISPQADIDVSFQDGHNPSTKPGAKKLYPKLVMHHIKDNY